MLAEVKKIKVSQILNAPNYQSLHDEYASNLVVDGAPPFRTKLEIYNEMESTGSFQAFGAFVEDTLIGFITVLAPVLPHIGVMMAVAESYFVAKGYRHTGAGIFLKRAAQNHSDEIGSPGLLVSAPVGGDLAKVLSNSDDYVETSRMFFRKRKNVE